ncbi:MAG: IS110 family transposase [Termitinemataceae bacterium]|nr:MAG: IS110 family transposase [Termitinemataceae bacterium]
MEVSKRRFVGIDLGKRTYTMAIIGKKGGVTMSNGRTCIANRQDMFKKLEATDKVTIEAGNLAFEIAKEIIQQVGCEVVVLNPSKLALIYGSMKKTDKEDELKLARIIEMMKDELLPIVPIPSDKEMRRRKLIAADSRAKRDRVRKLNLLHGLFLHQGITTIVKKDLATKINRDEVVKQLTGNERDEANYILEQLDSTDKWIKKLSEKMDSERKGDAQIDRLIGIPGVGPLVALAFVSFVGDVNRFDNASQVSNYLGLVPRVDISCSIVRYGGITKRGNNYLRGLLVQAAWSTVRSGNGGALKERYEYMSGRNVSKKKTIIGIAMRLGELMYTILKNETEYEVRKFRSGTGDVKILSGEAIKEMKVA